jgi:hypothetical protein
VKSHCIKLLTCCLFLGVFAVSPRITFAQNSSHIQHFGYYWGMNGANQVSSYVTTMFVNKPWTETTDATVLANEDISYLNSLNSLGIKGIVDVAAVFYV